MILQPVCLSNVPSARWPLIQAQVGRASPVVVMPNPFYQIYEGGALLAGATPQYLHTLAENNFALDYAQLPDDVWQRTQLVYVCSPANPTGRVMTMDEWQRLFALSDR